MNLSWKNFKENVSKLNVSTDSPKEPDSFCNCAVMQFDKVKHCCNHSSGDKKLFKSEAVPLILFIWFFTAGFYLFFFVGISQIVGEMEGKSFVSHIKMRGKHSLSAYKPGIYIINSLKKTKYIAYIKNIYVNPHEKNKIMIMVKPNYWGTLSENEKKTMRSEILKKWENLYNRTEYSEYFKAEVRFANS